MNQLHISMKLERSLHIKGNMTMTRSKQDNPRTPQIYLCMPLSTKWSKARLVISNFFLKSRTTSKLTSTNHSLTTSQSTTRIPSALAQFMTTWNIKSQTISCQNAINQLSTFTPVHSVILTSTEEYLPTISADLPTCLMYLS
jgi:hypothetical protein